MKQQTKLSQEQQQQHAVEHQTQSQDVREFAGAEELLRYDAANTAVPPGIAQRLKESTVDLPGPKPAWWKRLFGGNQP